MRPEKRSPATSGKVHRAGTDNISSASRGKKYHGIADLVEKNPQAHSVDVYAGRRAIGTIFQVEREHYAFGHYDQPLGVFPDRRAASTTIQRAFTGSLTTAPERSGELQNAPEISRTLAS